MRWPRGTNKGEKGKVCSGFLWELEMHRENGEFWVRLGSPQTMTGSSN